MTEERKKKKFQAIVFGIGLIIIGMSIFQIFIADGLQASIADYEQESIYTSNLRDNVRGYWHDMHDAVGELGFPDWKVNNELNLSLITEVDANVTIGGAVVNYYTAVLTLLMEITDFEGDNYLIPETRKEWLFSEGLISFI